MRILAVVLMLVVTTACSDSSEDRQVVQREVIQSDQAHFEVGDADGVERHGPQIVDAGNHFDCTPIRVWDGDGPIWCAEGMRVRLTGIAAREIDETCRDGHPCPATGGVEARDTLVNLIGIPVGTSSEGHILVEGEVLSCFSEGSALGARTSAWCVSPSFGDLSCEMIRRGAALRWDKYWTNHECSG